MSQVRRKLSAGRIVMRLPLSFDRNRTADAQVAALAAVLPDSGLPNQIDEGLPLPSRIGTSRLSISMYALSMPML